MTKYQESFTKYQESLERMEERNIIMVRSQKEMADALSRLGCTLSPIPRADSVIIGDTTILRDVVEREMDCGHSITTTRFAGEVDWCWTCRSMRTIIIEEEKVGDSNWGDCWNITIILRDDRWAVSREDVVRRLAAAGFRVIAAEPLGKILTESPMSGRFR